MLSTLRDWANIRKFVAIVKTMKYLNLIVLCCLSLLLFSCEDDEKLRQAETLKAAQQNDSLFKIIKDNWKFNVEPPTGRVQTRISNWNEWQQFKTELGQKPTGSITTYRLKTKNLVNKADQLRNNIPPMFDKPQVRSRIGVLITKIKTLYTFISIETIQDKKVISVIGEITHEMNSLQNQLDEIIRISEIPKEMGEEEMLRALDTIRMANPDAIPPQAPPRIMPAQRKPSNSVNLQRRRLQQLKPQN